MQQLNSLVLAFAAAAFEAALEAADDGHKTCDGEIEREIKEGKKKKVKEE